MSNKAIKIKLKSYDSKLIDSSAEKIINVAKATGATIYGPVPLPTRKEVFTVLRSVHVNKTSREQFELRTHKRLIGIIKSAPETMDRLSRVQLPTGVSIEIKMPKHN
ncbi:MAG: 30S ribosomal protein S10 [Candidatus Hepatoplasma vulgare]|nr:MAG: 30S ribosomal protein S10 [Candidatus Hepatoplasma sp.]